MASAKSAAVNAPSGDGDHHHQSAPAHDTSIHVSPGIDTSTAVNEIDEIQLAHLSSKTSGGATQERAYQPAPSSEEEPQGRFRIAAILVALMVCIHTYPY